MSAHWILNKIRMKSLKINPIYWIIFIEILMSVLNEIESNKMQKKKKLFVARNDFYKWIFCFLQFPLRSYCIFWTSSLVIKFSPKKFWIRCCLLGSALPYKHILPELTHSLSRTTILVIGKVSRILKTGILVLLLYYSMQAFE